MRIPTLAYSVGALMCVVLAGRLASAASDAPKTIISSGATSDVLVVKDVSIRDGTASGLLINKSKRVVRNVQLLIRHIWFWNNERHPGEDNPGRADYFTVAEEIPPGGTLPFTFRSDPLPKRADGHFATSAEVVGFTEVGE